MELRALNNAILTPVKQWTRKGAIALMAGCLLLGVGGGWLARTWQSRVAAGSAKVAAVATPAQTNPGSVSQMPNGARLKEMADAQAAPLLGRLKSDPNNPDLLTSIGNLYYDAQQYSIAIDFYGRVLKVKPSDVAVRTDMATAYWYMGDADTAITEFNQALTYEPNSPNALFNRGLVKWKGKMDIAGAEADWKKLLKENPNYDARDKVEQMMAEANKQAGLKPE